MSTVIIEGKYRIPDSVVDLLSFRKWTRSHDFPERGQYSYLGGELWVDFSMEQLFSHNLVKTKFTSRLDMIVEAEDIGYLCSARMLLTNEQANLATEPDVMFVSWDAVNSARVRLVPGAKEGFIEIQGSPDMVLEIVSESSEQKDTERLRELYHRAGVMEYWVVGARRDPPKLTMLRWEADEYAEVLPHDGWLDSEILRKSFRLSRSSDPLGNPRVTVEVM